MSGVVFVICGGWRFACGLLGSQTALISNHDDNFLHLVTNSLRQSLRHGAAR